MRKLIQKLKQQLTQKLTRKKKLYLAIIVENMTQKCEAYILSAVSKEKAWQWVETVESNTSTSIVLDSKQLRALTEQLERPVTIDVEQELS